jgi:hypothetical protein
VAEWSAGAVIAAYLLALARLDWWLPPAVCAAATVIAVIVTCSRARALSVWSVVWCMLATAWVLLARMHLLHPWTEAGAAPIVLAAAVMTPLGVRLVMHDRHAREQLAGRRPAPEPLRKWSGLLERADSSLAGIIAVSETEHLSGRTVELDLSGSKATDATLISALGKIERAGRYRRSSVRFETDQDDSARVLMHIMERDFLGTDIPLPHLPETLTVNRPLPVGRREDGEVAEVLWREVACLIIGATGAGKSNLINVLIALLSRCTDVLLFVIDGKNGRLVAPWIEPWVKGEGERPAIDWIACDRAESAVMLEAAMRYLDARMASLVGGSKLKPSPQYPQIVIICDETADLVGDSRRHTEGMTNARFLELIVELNRKARSEAVVPVWATQRGTNSFLGSGDLKSQCLLRFGLGVATEAEARSVIPDDGYVSRLLARLAHSGTGIVHLPASSRPMPVKFFRLDPAEDAPHGAADLARIRELAIAGGRVRPAPDETGLRAMGADWEDRWKRCELYAKIAGGEIIGDPPPLPADRVKSRLPLGRAEVASAWEQIIGGDELADLATRPKPGGRAPHPGHARAHALMADRPYIGLSPLELMTTLAREGIAPAREVLQRWLKDDVEAGLVEKLRGARYRMRQDRPG